MFSLHNDQLCIWPFKPTYTYVVLKCDNDWKEQHAVPWSTVTDHESVCFTEVTSDARSAVLLMPFCSRCFSMVAG